MKTPVTRVAPLVALVAVLALVAAPVESAQVFIKALTGKTITLDNVDLALDTISMVKSKVEDKEGIPAATQRLMFGGQQLDDDRTLASYDIPEEANIIMVLRATPKRQTSDGQPEASATSGEVAASQEDNSTLFDRQKALELFKWLFGDQVDLHRLETDQPGEDEKTAKLFFKAKPGYDVKVVREQLKSKLKWLFDLLVASKPADGQSSQVAAEVADS